MGRLNVFFFLDKYIWWPLNGAKNICKKTNNLNCVQCLVCAYVHARACTYCVIMMGITM